MCQALLSSSEPNKTRHTPSNSSSQIGSQACHSTAARRLEDCCAGDMWKQGGGIGQEMELVGQRGAGGQGGFRKEEGQADTR